MFFKNEMSNEIEELFNGNDSNFTCNIINKSCSCCFFPKFHSNIDQNIYEEKNQNKEQEI